MPFILNKNDRELLRSIAEYRVLTVSQVAALLQRSKRSARRRLGGLANEKLVELSERTFGTGPGRPEGIVSLAPRGITMLREAGTLSPTVDDDRVIGRNFRPLEHQLLVNWFRIHLRQIERVAPRFAVRFLSPTSPFLERGPGDEPLVQDHVASPPPSKKPVAFTPDGVFAITDSDRDKSLLFFLEVDRGTESLTSGKTRPGDIRRKVFTYQAYFRACGYKRYERFWSCGLTGFRLLILTNDLGRLSTMCRLVQELPPSDFVWLADQFSMFESGVAADIWARGGRNDKPLQSILGRQACGAMLPTRS